MKTYEIEKKVIAILHSVTNRFQPIYEIVARRMGISEIEAKQIIHNLYAK